MSKTVKETLVCNHVAMSKSGTSVQAVLARIRSDVPTLADGTPNPNFNGKTVRIPPHLFHGELPLPGEAFFAEFDPAKLENGNAYRTLRNAKISMAPQGSTAAASDSTASSDQPLFADQPQEAASEPAPAAPTECAKCGKGLNEQGLCTDDTCEGSQPF